MAAGGAEPGLGWEQCCKGAIFSPQYLCRDFASLL